MKDRIKDFFAFSKKEQRGLIVLLGLMLLTMMFNFFLPFVVPEKKFDAAPFQKDVEQFLAEMAIANSLEKNKPDKYRYEDEGDDEAILTKFKEAPFYFDPNKLSMVDWSEMGMDQRITNNIMRYREKGGKFRNKESFRKIYGMNDSTYSILEPYIRIAQAENKIQENNPAKSQNNFSSNRENRYEKHLPEPVMVELNSADSTALISLTGIGPSYAGRIIRYRDRLGGFYIKEQLLEIKGMDSIRFNQFEGQITIDQSLVMKIDINTVTFKDLLKHPYFEYYLVKAIFQKKDEIRKFDSLEQLKQVDVMYQELYNKIEPYLQVN